MDEIKKSKNITIVQGENGFEAPGLTAKELKALTFKPMSEIPDNIKNSLKGRHSKVMPVNHKVKGIMVPGYVMDAKGSYFGLVTRLPETRFGQQTQKPE